MVLLDEILDFNSTKVQFGVASVPTRHYVLAISIPLRYNLEFGALRPVRATRRFQFH